MRTGDTLSVMADEVDLEEMAAIETETTVEPNKAPIGPNRKAPTVKPNKAPMWPNRKTPTVETIQAPIEPSKTSDNNIQKREDIV